MYVAKMHTRYPEFHGEGYFNFLMDEDIESLDAMVEENSHDFGHVETKFIDMSQSELLKKYPTKYKLNEAHFNA